MEEGERASRVRGALLGTAVGDALGLPFEGLPPHRIARWLGARGTLRHRMWLGRGMISDDTEHAYLVAWALSVGGDFSHNLARGLRRWFLAAPPGIGLGTLRACLKLCLGVGPTRSGVFSAGNGPAMRAPILGVLADRTRLRALVHASTTLTHTDPRAEEGALAVALAAHLSAQHPASQPVRPLLAQVQEAVSGAELSAHLRTVAVALDTGQSPEALVAAMGLPGKAGVSGYINHTVPVALFLWARGGDLSDAIEDAIRLGGDTDSVAAIVGGLVGAHRGEAAIPPAWLDGMVDWPLHPARLRAMADAATRREAGPGLPFLPLCFLRNVFFFGPLAILHVLRRLLPPY